MIDWQGIVIHHSASPATTTIEQIDQWHKDRGFGVDLPDGRRFHIGYLFLVRSNGRDWVIKEGRPLSVHGAHCKGYNRTHIGVCLAGNFMTNDPPPDQLVAAADICASLCLRFRIPVLKIIAHRDVAKTDCPGDKLDMLLLKTMIESAINIKASWSGVAEGGLF